MTQNFLIPALLVTIILSAAMATFIVSRGTSADVLMQLFFAFAFACLALAQTALQVIRHRFTYFAVTLTPTRLASITVLSLAVLAILWPNERNFALALAIPLLAGCFAGMALVRSGLVDAESADTKHSERDRNRVEQSGASSRA